MLIWTVSYTQIENLSYAPLADCSIEDYDKVMDINAKGTMLCVRAQLKAMKSQEPRSYTGRTGTRDIGRGAIVNIASAHAHVGLPGKMAYTTSKHAVIGITKMAGKFHPLPPTTTSTNSSDQRSTTAPKGSESTPCAQRGSGPRWYRG